VADHAASERLVPSLPLRPILSVMRVLILATALLSLSSCTEPNPYLGVCGNGVMEAAFDEECDDGAGNGEASACSETCRVATCGDGITQPGEGCDLGAQNSNNGECTLTCEFATCGDDFKQPSEACDDGDANRWPPDGEPGCSIQCDLLPYCGDGIIQPDLGEQCDDANDVDDDTCSNACTGSTCGDAIIQAEEECDDANDDNSDACTNACTVAVCGDGIVHEGLEECDDANDDNSDACLNVCLAAICGDGVLREDLEECDDANDVDDDGCNNACGRDRLVFITEQTFTPVDLGNLSGADVECRKIAKDGGLANYDDFKAWLSDSTGSPTTRFVQGMGRYVLSTGEPIAADWDDLVDGELLRPIDRTLDGLDVGLTLVWTNTAPDGTTLGAGDEDCEDWTMLDPITGSYVGVSTSTDAFWTALDEITECSYGAQLYCFEN